MRSAGNISPSENMVVAVTTSGGQFRERLHVRGGRRGFAVWPAIL